MKRSNILFLIPFVFMFFCSVGTYAQQDNSLKPGTDMGKSKKELKKEAKAEAKIHKKSENGMDKQIADYHKKHYKKDFKYKAPNNPTKKEEKGM